MAQGIRSMAVLPCYDVARSAQFYIEKLCFTPAGTWKSDGDAQFAIVALGDVTIALQRADEWFPSRGAWSAYVYVDDVRGYFERITETGVTTDGPPYETFYGMLEFEVCDHEGHWIAFAQDLNPKESPGL